VTPAATTTRYGTQVALSGSGDELVVGSYELNSSAGAAWIFERAATVWTEATQGTVLPSGDLVGYSEQSTALSLNSAGDIMISGGPAESGNIGAGWLLTRSNDVWTEHSKIVGSGTVTGDQFGKSTAMSYDGQVFAFGAPGASSGDGAIYVYTWDGTTLVAKPVITYPSITGVGWGQRIAISGDGSVMMVTGLSSLQILVYTGVGGDFTFSEEITYVSPLGYDVVDIALSEDGTTVVVAGDDLSALNTVTNHEVTVYRNISTVWTTVFQEAPANTSVAATSVGVAQVSINSAGDRIASSRPRENNGTLQHGVVYVREEALATGDLPAYPGIWGLAGEFTGELGTQHSVGYSLAMSPDGTQVMYGDTFGSDGVAGAAYVVARDNSEATTALPWGSIDSTVSSQFEVKIKSSLNLPGAGVSVDIANVDSGYIGIGGTTERGGWNTYSEISLGSDISVSIPNRDYSVSDLVGELTGLFDGDDISYIFTFDSNTALVTIDSKNKSDISSVFVVDTLSTFQDFVFSSSVPATTQVSLDVDFTINNNVVKVVNPYLNQGADTIYDTTPGIIYREYRAGYGIEDSTDIDIQLRDERGKIMDIGGVDWIMTIYATIH
jgi:hypothetical protein